MYSEAFLTGIKSRVAISEVIGRSTKLRRDGKEFRAVDNASLTVNDAKALWFDHATNEGGDALAWLQKMQGLSFTDAVADLASMAGVPLPNGNGEVRPQQHGATAKRKLVAEYDYRDAQGEMIYQVVRLEWIEDGERKKTFQQRRPRPDRPGAWVWNLEGVSHGLYRLPELREAGADEIVFLPEGEKDAETLIGFGLVATTNSGGAKNWRQDHAELLRGRDVVVLVDNDDPGRERGKTIIASLHGVARRVRLLDFSHPDIWPESPKGADVTDWVKTREGNAEDLAEIIETLPDAKPAVAVASEPPPVDNLGAFGDRARGPDDAGAEEETSPPAAFTFDLAPYAFPDPASIPAREWLFGRHYIRGAVSATIGAPGRLKSTTVLTEIVGMAAGRDLMTGEALASGPLRAAYLNGEEVKDELDRRVAAICQHFGLKPQDCGGRLWVLSTRDKPIRVAIRGPRGDAMVQAAVVTALTDWCDQRQIDAIGIDPLISFHAVRESDNGDMDLVVKEAFGTIAGKTRAVDLVHHPRKLAPGESNATVDDARGASSVLGAVRLARTFNFMSTAEAAQLGIAEDDRRRHVRIENGKNNPGPIGKAHWVQIEVENLANGDAVAVSSSWTPPNPFDGVSVTDLKLVQNRVTTGEFRADSRSPDWLGWWMAENLPMLNIKTRHHDQPRNKAEVARLNSILKTWLKNNALEIETRNDDKGRKRNFFVSGTQAETSNTTPSADSDDDQISLQ